jgi:hypothetical protein
LELSAPWRTSHVITRVYNDGFCISEEHGELIPDAARWSFVPDSSLNRCRWSDAGEWSILDFITLLMYPHRCIYTNDTGCYRRRTAHRKFLL